jgi:glycosyltransferase involved in cell wall biosynthesis
VPQPTMLPRKVLHLFNSAGGGCALSTIELIESLRREGIESCAVCYDDGAPQEREAVREAVRGQVLFMPLYWWNRKIRSPLWKRPLVELRQSWRTGRGRRSARRVGNYAAEQDVDLIHTNTFVTPEGGIAARRLGLSHVWHVRELVGPGNPFRFRLEGPPLGGYLALHCSKLVANSYITAEQIASWLPAGMLEIVPNGLDLSLFEHVGPTGNAKTVVAMIGSLSARWKRHRLLIEAASQIDRGLNVEFRIYGHDPSVGGSVPGDEYVDSLHSLARQLGVADRFTWPGFVADRGRIMSEIDILVHPANMESFGRIAVEAMAAGRPVVGVRGGGVAEIVRDNVDGLLAEPDQPQDLAQKLERLIRNPSLRAEMGSSGKRRAHDQYSIAVCTKRLIDVYRMAMSRPLGAAAARA